MANGKCFGWNWLSSVSILCLAVCVCDRMKDDGICGRHLFYITRQLFLLFNVKEWTNTAMSPGAQVQGAASTSVASALINQSYEACKWQCLYIIPHTHTQTHRHRHTHTHTYTHTDSHSHTVRITHHIWACHRKMEHSTDTHTVRTTYHGGWTALAAFCLQQWSLLTCVQGLGPAVNSLHRSAKQHSIYKSPLMQYVSTMTSRKYKLKTQAYTEKREDRAG